MEYSLIFILFFVHSFTISGSISTNEDGYCVSYEFGYGKYGLAPCISNKPARPLDQNISLSNNLTAMELLRNTCPYYASGENPHTCCSVGKLLVLQEKLEILQGFGLGRCPSCMENFRRMMCDYSCSPIQNKMMRVIRTKVYEAYNDIPEQEIVEELEFFISKKFSYDLYASCEGIQGLLPGKYIFDFVCGSYGRSQCSPERWMELMGATPDEGGYSPFKAVYRLYTTDTVEIDNVTFYPWHAEAYKCSESPGPGYGVCSCNDCSEACSADALKPPQLPPPVKPFLILDFDGTLVISILVFLTFFLLITVLFCYLKQSVIPTAEVLADINFGYLAEVESLKTACKYSIVESKEVITKSMQKSSKCHFIGYHLEEWLGRYFKTWAFLVVQYPKIIMFSSFLISLLLSSGLLFNLEVTTNPKDLWTSNSSEARHDLEYFNTHFGPFYRIEQIIITSTYQENFHYPILVNHELKNISWGPIFRQEFLLAALNLQLEIENLTVNSNDSIIKLQDICVSPLNTACAIQSLFGFFQNKKQHLENKTHYLTHFKGCSMSPTDPKCFSTFGGPIHSAEVVLGDFDQTYDSAKALIITLPVINYNDDNKNFKAREWEKEFLTFMNNFSHPLLNVAFMAERSIQDELERTSHSDIYIVAISYIIMLFYITMSLGEFHKCKTLLLESKFTLGLFGVLIVFLSVISSFGIFCLLGFPVTIIILEVIPFLVLAVGIDNIFILVQAFQREEKKAKQTLNEKICDVVGKTAPSMLLSSVSMSSCFFIGALSEMPAVRIFALYAGVALIVNFFLQMTCFLALFILDTKRQENSRLDACCCLKTTQNLDLTFSNKGIVYNLINNLYAPFLMKNSVRYIILMVFVGWLCSSVAVLDKIDVGLDLKLAVPEDSYMKKYFEFLEKYLSVGPPLYFVITDGYNYSDPKMQKKVCSSHSFCDLDSLTYHLGKMAMLKNRTYIAFQPLSWMDHFMEFLRSESCCFEFRENGTYCPSYLAFHTKDICKSCQSKEPSTLSETEFNRRLSFFVSDSPWNLCPKAGKAMFSTSIELSTSNHGIKIGATNFMTYHTVLKSSADYSNALEWSRIISKNITESLQNSSANPHLKVFPYSLPHIYYEQYLTMWPDTFRSLGMSIAAIFIATFLLLGMDFHSSMIVTLTVTSIVLNLMGLMYWWNISLNAITLVNLVVAVGISVEFCSHLTRSFALSDNGSKVDRARDALSEMGTSILCGITLTDCGILVLAFAKSPIFKIVYFRMYFGIIAFGTLHGLILLPVLLSIFGPSIRQKKASTTLSVSDKNEVEMSIHTPDD